jgi:hypothetical protein
MYGGFLIKRKEGDRDYYEETTKSELKFPEKDQPNFTKILLLEKPKKGFLKYKPISKEYKIKYIDILEVLLILNAHLAKGTNSICINYEGVDIATIANKYTFLGSGSFKMGATIECDDSSIQLISFLFTDNSEKDIKNEFESLTTFATNNSPFISQFYYGFDLYSLKFYYKNVIYRIPDLINTKIFPSLKPIWKEIKTRYPLIYAYLIGNTIINDKHNITTGNITVEKGDYTLDYIFNSSKKKHSETTKTRIGFLTFIYNLSKVSDIPWAFLCYNLEILLGFYTFYTKGYIHGDFKYDNVVWKSTKVLIGRREITTGIIQLIDFGLSSKKEKNWTCGARSHRPFKLLPYKYNSKCDKEYDYPELAHSKIDNEDLFDTEYDIYSLSSATIKRLFGISNYDNYCDGYPQISLISKINRDHSFDIYSSEIKEMFEFMDNQNEKIRTKIPDAIKTIWDEFMKLDLDNQFHPQNLIKKWGNVRNVSKDNFENIFNKDNFPDYIVEYSRDFF